MKIDCSIEGDLTALYILLARNADGDDPDQASDVTARAELVEYDAKESKYTCSIDLDDDDLPATVIVDTRGLYARRLIKVTREGSTKPLIEASGKMAGRAQFVTTVRSIA